MAETRRLALSDPRIAAAGNIMARSASAGYTLAELVLIIVVAGVLTAVAVTRLVGRESFDARGYFDKAKTVVRYAQKVAIAQQRAIFVCVESARISIAAASGCGTPLNDPGTGQPLSEAAPAGVALAGPEFSFDALGRPSAAAQITLTTTFGDPVRNIVVEAETGYVHP